MHSRSTKRGSWTGAVEHWNSKSAIRYFLFYPKRSLPTCTRPSFEIVCRVLFHYPLGEGMTPFEVKTDAPRPCCQDQAPGFGQLRRLGLRLTRRVSRVSTVPPCMTLAVHWHILRAASQAILSAKAEATPRSPDTTEWVNACALFFGRDRDQRSRHDKTWRTARLCRCSASLSGLRPLAH